MSRLSKLVIGVLILVIVALLIMWYVPVSNTLSTGTMVPVQEATTTINSTSTPTTTAPVLPKSDVAQRDDSDASLEADLKSVDALLKAATDDAAAVDKSLKDTPISQNP